MYAWYFWARSICPAQSLINHDDVIKWKHFLHYWPFVQGIHQALVNSPHKGQWRGASIFSLICAWINTWVNNHEPGDLRCHRPHYYVIVTITELFFSTDFTQNMSKSITWHSLCSWLIDENIHTRFNGLHTQCTLFINYLWYLTYPFIRRWAFTGVMPAHTVWSPNKFMAILATSNPFH